MGAANRTKEAFPNAKIRVFAAIRTISNPDEFSNFIEPCTGKIKLRKMDAFRTPDAFGKCLNTEYQNLHPFRD